MRQEDEIPPHPRLADEVFTGFLEAMDGVSEPEDSNSTCPSNPVV